MNNNTKKIAAELPKQIAITLKATRERKYITQGRVARYLSMSQPNLSRAENGTQNFSFEQFYLYCEVINIDPEYIMRIARLKACDIVIPGI